MARGDAWRAVVVALVRLVRTCSSGILYADAPFFPCRGGRRKGDFQILQGGGLSDCCACNVGVYAQAEICDQRGRYGLLCAVLGTRFGEVLIWRATQARWEFISGVQDEMAPTMNR